MTRLGLWGARADRGGLATITTELARHLCPSKVMGVDLGQHGRGPSDWGLYLDGDESELTIHFGMDNFTDHEIHRWLTGVDVAYTVEVDYHSGRFLDACRERGVPSVLCGMPELAGPEMWAKPTALVNPTTWRHHLLPDHAQILPVPVPLDRFDYRQRTEARTFFHLAAPAFKDRNGTELVMAALAHVTEPCRFILRENPAQRLHLPSVIGPVELSVDRRDVAHWSDVIPPEADVLVLPRRFGGLSLPMTEAAAQGVPTLSLDLEPQNEWLAGPQCPTTGRRAMAMQGGTVDVFQADPHALAATIDAWARSPDVAGHSAEVRRHAQSVSWDALGRDYRDLIESVANEGARV